MTKTATKRKPAQAAKKGKPLAERRRRKLTSLIAGLESLAGRAVGLPADLAKEHDKYLHGDVQ